MELGRVANSAELQMNYGHENEAYNNMKNV